MEESLKDRITIKNNFNIEADLRKQSQHYFEVGEKIVDARNERDELSERLKMVKAELDVEIRSNATAKLTEAGIAAKIITDKRYIDVQERFLAKEKEVGYLDVALKALEHKRGALETLAKMQMSGIIQAKSSIGAV
jgi:hypothetical protein